METHSGTQLNCRQIFRFSVSIAVLTVWGMALSACSDTLVYGERTGFNLAIEVNQDPETPVNVNAGLRRTIVGVVPPRSTESDGKGGSKSKGEAVSMISGFDLTDDTQDNQLNRGLQIQTQFASGQAATIVSSKPETAAAIVTAIAAPNIARSSGWAEEAARARSDRLISSAALLDDASIIDLASNPPVTDQEVESTIAIVDPNNRRSTNAAAAFHVLKTRIYMSSVAHQSIWDSEIRRRLP